MFHKTLSIILFAKDRVLIAIKIARDWDWKTRHLTIASVYLYWSEEYQKIQIWLCLTVARSGDIARSLFIITLCNVQNNNMIRIALYLVCRYISHS